MSSLRTYLQLMRFPAVFTAMGDILLGFMLNHEFLNEAPWDLGLLLVASSCLYLAGMVLNDVFDREVDARERPKRPIPSGRVSVQTAATLGGLLLLAGIGAASTVGVQSLIVAGLLTACILLYDAWAKKTFLGPLVMGGCRFLNVILGASAHVRPGIVWGLAGEAPQLWIAAGLGIYIVGVTWFARQEATQSDRRQLVGAWAIINAGLLLLLSWAIRATAGEPGQTVTMLCFLAIIVMINRRPVAAIRDPRPERVQGAIRVMLLSLLILNAMLVFIHTTNSLPAIIIASLLIPATFLGRWIFVT